MTTDRIIDFPIRRPLPTGERQRTRQCVADSRALVLPYQRRGTFSTPQPASAVDEIVAAWLANLSEEA